ncbi:MAG: homocysteine S-methyltransferase family protein [Candidatus Cloacimonetes bacterium]|nr:homocysteine S-methyltransferase family protein [Candidatus Cloacimonadota bacterium]MBL7149488.1 homocysteine S-methyltransferase family protein [Candidatus Cloacimonadota bacterium]
MKRKIILVEVGISIIGFCCGTTPEYIQAIRKVVDNYIENN